eukprot:4506523-Alexandrium_andersonii.AAC.1
MGVSAGNANSEQRQPPKLIIATGVGRLNPQRAQFHEAVATRPTPAEGLLAFGSSGPMLKVRPRALANLSRGRQPSAEMACS